MCSFLKRWSLLLAIGITSSAGSIFVSAQQGTENGQWRYYSATVGGTKYSPLQQIDRTNLKDLRVVWRWESADRALQRSNPLWRAARNEETPLMIDGTLYTVTGLGLVAALDPATGRTRWV